MPNIIAFFGLIWQIESLILINFLGIELAVMLPDVYGRESSSSILM